MSDIAQSLPRKISPWRLMGWGIIATLLLLPAILRFPWTASDFVIMGLLLGSVGVGIEFLVRRSGSTFTRLGAAVAVIASFLTIWVNLAVGMIGDGKYNLLFAGVILFGLCGMAITRLATRPTSIVMVITAALELAAALGGYAQDPRGAVLSCFFVVPWLAAAALFRAGGSR